MSQLIALIIAIALGAIVTAIGFVFLGDAFTKNSERGVALQFVSQASQVEMAMTAHRAEQARSAFDNNLTDTFFDDTDVSSPEVTGLVSLGYLKDQVVAPFGDYQLLQNGTKVYLVVESTEISDNVCLETLKLKDKTTALTAAPDLGTGGTLIAQVVASLGTDVYGCYVKDVDTNVFAYRVE